MSNMRINLGSPGAQALGRLDENKRCWTAFAKGLHVILWLQYSAHPCRHEGDTSTTCEGDEVQTVTSTNMET